VRLGHGFAGLPREPNLLLVSVEFNNLI
jgi:hypothetical protein